MGAGQQQQRGERTAHGGGIGPERYDDGGYQGAGTGRNAYTRSVPLGVTPVPEGGVAIGGQPNLQASQASMTDRIVGKTEKVGSCVF
ncbi:hypothetical protein EDC04DRAFT_2720790 [Pisolithus marmoratus]|nr:hypothetical protein EDC04DRAFT_2720790 [Pisolithus marmoratus]